MLNRKNIATRIEREVTPLLAHHAERGNVVKRLLRLPFVNIASELAAVQALPTDEYRHAYLDGALSRWMDEQERIRNA